MAYITQEKKKELAPGIKAVCKKHGVSGTLSVHNHSILVLTVRRGKINFPVEDRGYMMLNHHHPEIYEKEVRGFLAEVVEAMNIGNHDNSDIMTDYFDVGWYIEIYVGNWKKPYKYEGK